MPILPILVAIVGTRLIARCATVASSLASGRAYAPQDPVPEVPSSSLVVPVHREDPAVFRRALASWLRSGVSEIVVVADADDESVAGVLAEPRDSTVDVIHVRKTCSKREALVEGVRMTKCDIVVLVDSDTLWPDRLLHHLFAPFSDDRVGAVTVSDRARDVRSFSQRLFDVASRYGYAMDFPQAALRGTVPCLIGRTSAYRRGALLPALPALVVPSKRSMPGDDMELTRELRNAGWRLAWQSSAAVLTEADTDVRVVLSQMVRWRRNRIRSRGKGGGSRSALSIGKIAALLSVFDPPLILLSFLIDPYVGMALAIAATATELTIARFILGPASRAADIVTGAIYSYVSSYCSVWAIATHNRATWANRS